MGQMPQEGAPAPVGGPLSHSSWPLLTKLRVGDDIEAYLEAFERTAEAPEGQRSNGHSLLALTFVARLWPL